MEELNELLIEYETEHPEDESPSVLLNSLGIDGLVQVLQERDGRRVIIEYDFEQVDLVNWRYE